MRNKEAMKLDNGEPQGVTNPDISSSRGGAGTLKPFTHLFTHSLIPFHFGGKVKAFKPDRSPQLDLLERHKHRQQMTEPGLAHRTACSQGGWMEENFRVTASWDCENSLGLSLYKHGQLPAHLWEPHSPCSPSLTITKSEKLLCLWKKHFPLFPKACRIWKPHPSDLPQIFLPDA